MSKEVMPFVEQDRKPICGQADKSRERIALSEHAKLSSNTQFEQFSELIRFDPQDRPDNDTRVVMSKIVNWFPPQSRSVINTQPDTLMDVIALLLHSKSIIVPALEVISIDVNAQFGQMTYCNEVKPDRFKEVSNPHTEQSIFVRLLHPVRVRVVRDALNEQLSVVSATQFVQSREVNALVLQSTVASEGRYFRPVRDVRLPVAPNTRLLTLGKFAVARKVGKSPTCAPPESCQVTGSFAGAHATGGLASHCPVGLFKAPSGPRVHAQGKSAADE